MSDRALKGLAQKFNEIYSATGRPSIAPEKLLRALLLQVLYTVRSERLLMEQLEYNLLFRWFVGLNMDEPVWVATVFSKNRDRLLEGDIAERFFDGVLKQAREADLLSDEHFSVDGTLIEARQMILAIRRWTSMGRSGAMTHMSRRPMPMPDWRERAAATRRNWPTAATC